MGTLKPETIEKICEVLNFDDNERKDRMLHLIENGYDVGLDARIAEYRAAFNALENFEDWAEEAGHETD